MTLRKVIKTRGSFPNEESAMKLLYLALRNVSKKWGPLPNWKEALNRFALLWEARFPQLEFGHFLLTAGEWNWSLATTKAGTLLPCY